MLAKWLPVPATVGSTASFRITVTNTGSSSIETLPLQDDYSTCLAFQSSSPAAGASGGGAAVWLDLLPGVSQLAPLAAIEIEVEFPVVGACDPAPNLADVSFAVDVNGDPVPPASDSATVSTSAASISGQVRNDTDGDGDLSDLGAGIANVTVRLYTDPNGDGAPSDGQLVSLTTTDAGGGVCLLVTDAEGLFGRQVAAGDAAVDIVDATLPSGVPLETDVSGQGTDPTVVHVPVGGVGADVTGYVMPAGSGLVDGTVYIDENGVNDEGTDVSLPGVTVEITDSTGGVYHVVTDSEGRFRQMVPAGSTTVDVVDDTLPAGAVLVPLVDNSDPTMLDDTDGDADFDTEGNPHCRRGSVADEDRRHVPPGDGRGDHPQR